MSKNNRLIYNSEILCIGLLWWRLGCSRKEVVNSLFFSPSRISEKLRMAGVPRWSKKMPASVVKQIRALHAEIGKMLEESDQSLVDEKN